MLIGEICPLDCNATANVRRCSEYVPTRRATMTYLKLPLLLALTTLCIWGGAADTAPAPASFVGAWKLQSFSFQKEDGSVVYPFGEKPEGIAIYDARGHLSTQIMRADIPKFHSRERTGEPTDQETRTAYEGFIAYGGSYEVDADKKVVVFHVKVSSYPNWVGTDLKRSFEFAEGRLILRAKIPSMEGTPATLVQIWNRTD
jgi:Lipocalin-like domain